MLRPSAFSCANSSNNSPTSLGLKPSDGSSNISSDGRAINALPIASICCSPPDSVDAGMLRRRPRLGNRA